MKKAIEEYIKDQAENAGYVFGKYTRIIEMEEKLIEILDNSNEAMRLYIKYWNEGVKMGMRDTHRSEEYEEY